MGNAILLLNRKECGFLRHFSGFPDFSNFCCHPPESVRIYKRHERNARTKKERMKAETAGG